MGPLKTVQTNKMWSDFACNKSVKNSRRAENQNHALTVGGAYRKHEIQVL